MPAFEVDGPRDTLEWQLIQNSSVHLFWRQPIFDDAVEVLTAAGYRVYRLDASDWADTRDGLSRLGEALGFPDYYGRNLDAFNDCLSDVATFDYGASPADTGTVLALVGYHAFTAREPRSAPILLDIFATQSRRAALIGHRMLCLVQTDDPKAHYPPVGATPVMWHPAEWLDAKRQP